MREGTGGGGGVNTYMAVAYDLVSLNTVICHIDCAPLHTNPGQSTSVFHRFRHALHRPRRAHDEACVSDESRKEATSHIKNGSRGGGASRPLSVLHRWQ